jgi:hypothetical protein
VTRGRNAAGYKDAAREPVKDASITVLRGRSLSVGGFQGRTAKVVNIHYTNNKITYVPYSTAASSWPSFRNYHVICFSFFRSSTPGGCNFLIAPVTQTQYTFILYFSFVTITQPSKPEEIHAF